MPGLVGIITNRPSDESQERLGIMLSSMMHEPFYIKGAYIDADVGAYLGWVCHKDSFVDCMPIWNETRDTCLLFYGENYVDDETVNTLALRGHKFSSDDASYLVHLFEEKGDAFFSELNGFFHGVLIDLIHKEVIIFNDRYAMQRLYLYETQDAIFFASEAKALLKVCPELREILPGSLAQLLSMGCILGNVTLFKNILLLPGGTCWKFKNGNTHKRGHYFKANTWEKQDPLSKEDFYSQLRESLFKVVPKYFNSSRPIGMSLTGGLDTRIIMAYAHRLPQTLPCYTFGSMYRDGFDVTVARKVAEKCGQQHHTIKVDASFLSQFSQLTEKAVYISDGYFDAGAGAIEIYLNAKAREIAPIRMTGNYGSEVLRNIRGLRCKPPNYTLFDEEFLKYINRTPEIFTEATNGNPLSFAVFKQTPWFNYNKVSLEQSQVTWRTPFMDNELVGLAYRAPFKSLTSDDLSLRLVKDENLELARIVTNRGAGGDCWAFASNSIKFYYKMLQMAEIGYDYGMPHWLSKVDHYLASFKFERLFLGRNDIYHFRTWYRNELSTYLREILLDSKSLNRPYWKKRSLEMILNAHIQGEKNYTNEIGKVLTIELTYRLLIEDI